MGRRRGRIWSGSASSRTELLRIVRRELGHQVGILNPQARPSRAGHADLTRMRPASSGLQTTPGPPSASARRTRRPGAGGQVMLLDQARLDAEFTLRPAPYLRHPTRTRGPRPRTRRRTHGPRPPGNHPRLQAAHRPRPSTRHRQPAHRPLTTHHFLRHDPVVFRSPAERRSHADVPPTSTDPRSVSSRSTTSRRLGAVPARPRPKSCR